MNSPLVTLVLVLAIGAVTTVVVECLFWGSFREYRKIEFIVCCAIANCLSNVMLNVSLLIWSSVNGKGIELLSSPVLLGEACVVVFEYLVFLMMTGKDKLKLFLLTLSANCITYSLSFVFRCFR